MWVNEFDEIENVTLTPIIHKHPDIRKMRGELYSCVSTIINRALQKDPEKRYQDGNQMAAASIVLKKQRDGIKL